MKITNDEGEDIEVFTAEERDAFVATAVEQKVGETKVEYETRLKEREEYHAQQGTNAGALRKMNEEQLKELSAKDRIIYDNQVALEAANTARATAEGKIVTDRLEAQIKLKANGDADVEKKIRDNLQYIAIDPVTPEQVDTKVAMALGVVFQQQPDIMAMAAAHGGTVYPGGVKPEEKKEDFADTERGKAIAAAHGFIVTPPKTT